MSYWSKHALQIIGFIIVFAFFLSSVFSPVLPAVCVHALVLVLCLRWLLFVGKDYQRQKY